MALVQLLQNLQNFNYYSGGPGNFLQKKIPFGSDQPGGLNSGEPYVQFPLPDVASPSILAYYQGNRASLDFPIRGGNLQITQGGIISTRAAEFDFRRIQRFLKSDPKGSTFITKQVGLQFSNPKLEVGRQVNVPAGELPTTVRFLGSIETTRVYNAGLNTLAQVRVQGSGVHVDRHGLIPFNPQNQTYSRVVERINLDSSGFENRLVVLLNNKVLGGSQLTTNPGNPADPVNTEYLRNLDSLLRLGIPRSNDDILFQYPGGPGSTLGIGLTTIRRYQNSNSFYSTTPQVQGSSLADIMRARTKEQASELGYVSALTTPPLQQESGITNNRLIILRENLATGNTNSPVPQNRAVSRPVGNQELYRVEQGQELLILTKAADTTTTNTKSQLVADNPATNNTITFNYNDFYTLTAQDSFKVKKQFTDFRTKTRPSTAVNYGQQDMVKRIGVSNAGAARGLEGADKVNLAAIGEDYSTSQGVNDLIKFKFDCIEYGAATPIPILFRAYLTSFQDSHSSEYQPFRYVGRGENFYTYVGFTRQISFSFKIAIQSQVEFTPVYSKLKYLLSQVYPDYSPAGFMRTPVTSLTIGRYLYQQPGKIDNLTVTVADDYPWEIDLNSTDDVFESPQVLDITCTFTPIQSYLPRRSTGKIPVPVITGK